MVSLTVLVIQQEMKTQYVLVNSCELKRLADVVCM